MSWDLNVKVGKAPEAGLVTSRCSIWVDGTKKPRGAYTIDKGSTIKYRGRVKNVGSVEGTIGVFLVDTLAGTVKDRKSQTLGPGEEMVMSGSFEISGKRALRFEGRHKAKAKGKGGWKTDETYGPWMLSVKPKKFPWKIITIGAAVASATAAVVATTRGRSSG